MELDAQRTVTYTSDATVVPTQGSLLYSNSTVGLLVDAAGAATWTDPVTRFSNVRFDSAGTGGMKAQGTVFTDARATYSLSLTDPSVPQSARHIDDALHHPERTFPSFLGKNVPSELHRDTDPNDQTANNNAAVKTCNSVWGPYNGSLLNCDEYPFKTTKEGAAKGTATTRQGSSTRRTIRRPAIYWVFSTTATEFSTGTRSTPRLLLDTGIPRPLGRHDIIVPAWRRDSTIPSGAILCRRKSAVGAMMPDVAEVRRFLVPTDRGIVTLQSSGVDVYEDHLIPGLTQAVAKAGRYQVWLSSIAQDLVKIRIIAYRVAPDSVAPDTVGDIVCDQQSVDFYDGTVTIRPLAMGIEERFTLPEGAGRYRVIVTTDLDSRTETARRAMDIIGAESDPDATRARLAEYDGHEWYGVYFQYMGVIIDDEDDD